MSFDWNQFHLMRPEWLWGLLPAALFAIVLWRGRQRSGGWSEVIAPELLPFLVGSQVSRKSPNFLPVIFIGWILAVIAVSGPSWEKIPQPIHQKQDAMILVLDLSHSMKAGDLAPSRLSRARQKLLDLLAQRKEGQTGLIAYAGDSHIVTPLTDDHPTIANLLPVLSPDMMPVPGSNAPAAVRQAVELLHSAGIRRGHVVLVTDGVSEADAEAVTEIISNSDNRFSILGVGTSSGAPIPLLKGGFLKDRSGAIVIPKLEQPALQALARNSGGQYLGIQLDDSDLEQLLSAAPQLPDQSQTLTLDRTADAWHDKGYLFALPLLPLVLSLFRRGWLLCLVPTLFLGAPHRAEAQSWDDLWYTKDQQGQRALETGDPKAAATLFENPSWAGTAAYRDKDYESAATRFSEGASAADWYNRGNALARSGELDDAIAAYKKSLELLPDQADAQENIELLEQLKDQQEQQQQNDENNDQQDQDQQDKEQNQENEENQDDPADDSEKEPSESDQDPQQDEPDQPEDGEDNKDSENEQAEQPQEEEPPQEPEEPQEQPAEAEPEESTPESEEEEQAMQQWLRRVPDDPSGLLREKFRYESRQRQEQDNENRNETGW